MEAEKVLFKDETDPAATVVVVAGVAVSQYWKPTDTAALPGAVWVRLPFRVAVPAPVFTFAPLALTAGACAIDTVALVFKF